ncbi:MAG TPA: DUF1501 domain-containing protein [Chitinolyticbacter sp.]|nr:DUF1501 domain-containing protein [Chitinolyticbacter sp.]
MQRRDFLRLSLLAGGACSFPGLIPEAAAAVSLNRRSVLSITLAGGPDFRHLFPPAIAANEAADSYAFRWWAARAASQGIEAAQRNRDGYFQRYSSAYTSLNRPGTATPAGLGILASCGWLKERWDAGELAIVHNVVGAVSRDHAHSLLVMDHGDRSSGPIDNHKPGWGGRLAAALGGNARVAALTSSPRAMCLGPGAGGRATSEVVIGIANSRKLALSEKPYTPGGPAWQVASSDKALSRSLKAYYQSRRFSDPALARLANHEKVLRDLGARVTARLGTGETSASGALVEVPAGIRALYADGLPWKSRYWGMQARNLHDVLALSDVINAPVLSMDYGGWDTHKAQRENIETSLSDLFASGKGLDLIWQQMDQAARDNLTIVIYGEFGRQLAANGDAGTDHGRGNAVLVIGGGVRGGVYGTPFPERELALFGRSVNDDILGQTGIEHVLGSVADWVAGGSTGNSVFNRSNSLIETGFNPALLFT